MRTPFCFFIAAKEPACPICPPATAAHAVAADHTSDRTGDINPGRRQLIRAAAAAFTGVAGAGLIPGLQAAVYAAGSDKPEKEEVRIGVIPLTDCASVVMASVLGFDKKYGVKIIPTKEASWAGVRDKLVNGELDIAHVLYGLVYGVHMGIGGAKEDMAVLMTLNHNGQAITLSRKLADKGAVDGPSLAKRMAGRTANDGREYTFAQTFPTGTHAMWLYYWMAAAGINPIKDAKVMAIIEAGRWIDSGLQNKMKMAETIADKSYVNTSVDAINQRILGRYQNGLGKTWDDPNHMKFFNDGTVNFPYLSDGLWFLTQHKRWGLLKDHPDYLAVAKQGSQIDLYKEAAAGVKAAVPKDVMRSARFIDGVVWDVKNPAAYADGFKIKA